MLERFADVQHGLDAHVVSGERLGPLRTRACPQHGLDRRYRPPALLAVDETALGQFRQADDRDELTPELRLERAHREIPVRTRVDPVAGIPPREHPLAGSRCLAAGEELRRVHGSPAHEPVDHRDIAVLSAARAYGGVKRDHDRERGIERAATEISDLQTRHRRTDTLGAAEHEHPRNRGVVEVMPGAIAKRSILAITTDAAEDDPGIDLTEGGLADAEAVHHAGAEALHDHVGSRRQAEKRLTSQGILEVQGERALVPIDRVEHRGVLVDERRHPAHVVAASRVLDLDHIRAEVREQQGAERSGKQSREIEDSNVVECRHGRASVAITPRPRSPQPLC